MLPSAATYLPSSMSRYPVPKIYKWILMKDVQKFWDDKYGRIEVKREGLGPSISIYFGRAVLNTSEKKAQRPLWI